MAAVRLAAGALVLAAAAATAGCSRGPQAEAAAPEPPRTAVEDCSSKSSGDFGDAFADPRNLVVGPLVLVGGATFTPAPLIEELGGQKLPVLVRTGAQASLQVPGPAQSTVALGYGPLPQGKTGLEDGYAGVMFRACEEGGPVTFWSGAVLVAEPACVPLDVYVSGHARPERVELELGRRCSDD